MLLRCVWLCSALALMVTGQTYYINFVFNNYHGAKKADDKSQIAELVESESVGSCEADCETVESKDEPEYVDVLSDLSDDEYRDDSSDGHKGDEGNESLEEKTTERERVEPEREQVQPEREQVQPEWEQVQPEWEQVQPEREPPLLRSDETYSSSTIVLPREIPTPHPSEFFHYPEAVCSEDMYLHELFGVTMSQDRGLPVKVMCTFQNSWGGPWLLMNRMELPVRVHMRHWIFGYLTEDYKDLNINFLSLAYLMNVMRIAMLVIGQNNENQLVYNLYDNVVISSIDDLFMLRKAHLIEANTTDLLFISVGQVLLMDTGKNRSCPFQVAGGWWGQEHRQHFSKYYCVFPVERNISLPGYVAIFIKPSPFPINNTAFYATEITTRRPWETTLDATIMAEANGSLTEYNKIIYAKYMDNKDLVKHEVQRRMDEQSDPKKPEDKQ